MTATTFGDTVRVRTTDATTQAGFAGLEGSVFGQTVPSQSGVNILGELEDDYAINVYFECCNTDVWLDPSLVELIDHDAVQEFSLDNSSKKYVRGEDGEWIKQPKSANSRPWWKFW